MIKAPYNFVPIHKRVYFPDWADKISHDLPFSDGESGVINMKITAHSPVFVRNGSKSDQEDDQFSNINGRFFIPGTSIKGMVRSILEIMSFGKIGNVQKWTPTFRDLSGTPTGELYKNSMKGVHCGWLKISKNSSEAYEIEDCGEPRRITHKKIDEKWKTSFAQMFKKQPDQAYKKAEGKIKDLEAKGYDLHTVYCFTPVNQNSDKGIKQYEFSNHGDIQGKLVVTGQPGNRNESNHSGKHLEFIFTQSENPEIIQVPKEVFKNFKFAYYDGDLNNESEDWTYWQKKLYDGESIPIFFKKSGSSGILHFGLSFLYKLPYKYGIQQAVENLGMDHGSDKLDLAQSMFGTIANNQSLKGRISFSPGFAVLKTIKELEKVQTVLGSPKTSYYPTYIRNKEGYGSEKLELAGRKRYPVHKNSRVAENKGTKNVSTSFIPLDEGGVFESKIRFHNLRKIEIGALISALTFHGNNETLFHSIGMAKPLGYGKIKINISPQGLDHDQKTYMNAFVNAVEEQLALNWAGSQQIIELMTMASEQNNSGSSELSYMDLAMGGNNEFIEAKNQKEQLQIYSRLKGVKMFSLMSEKDYYKEIETQTIEELKIYYNEHKDLEKFNAAFESFLEKNEFNPEFNPYYPKFWQNPLIAAKYIKNLSGKKPGQRIKECLKHIKPVIDLTRPEYQQLFEDILIKLFDSIKLREQFPLYLAPLIYTWEDVWAKTGINEDNCLDFLEGLDQRVWPPKEEFRNAVKHSNLDPDIIEMILSEL